MFCRPTFSANLLCPIPARMSRIAALANLQIWLRQPGLSLPPFVSVACVIAAGSLVLCCLGFVVSETCHSFFQCSCNTMCFFVVFCQLLNVVHSEFWGYSFLNMHLFSKFFAWRVLECLSLWLQTLNSVYSIYTAQSYFSNWGGKNELQIFFPSKKLENVLIVIVIWANVHQAPTSSGVSLPAFFRCKGNTWT